MVGTEPILSHKPVDWNDESIDPAGRALVPEKRQAPPAVTTSTASGTSMQRGSAYAGDILYDMEIQKRVVASGAVRWRVRWRQGNRYPSQTFDRQSDAVNYLVRIRPR